jgi:hypothetical protein
MVLTCIWTIPSDDSLLNDHPLAHSMPGAGVVHHIIFDRFWAGLSFLLMSASPKKWTLRLDYRSGDPDVSEMPEALRDRVKRTREF